MALIAMPIDRTPDVIDADIERAIAPALQMARPWRWNRFRIYFEAPPGTPRDRPFGRDLLATFGDYFHGRLVAVDSYPAGGGTAISFKANVPGPDLHYDHVKVIGSDDRTGFAVQTVRRTNLTGADRIVRGAVTAGGGLRAHRAGNFIASRAVMAGNVTLMWLGLVAARLKDAEHLPNFADRLSDYVVAVNQRHFLAGRRSWRIGHVRELPEGRRPDGPDMYFVETAAIERVSRPEFNVATTMFDETAHEIWCAMLEDYARLNDFAPVDFTAFSPGGRTGNVSMTTGSHPDQGGCRAATADLRRMHPNLLPASLSW